MERLSVTARSIAFHAPQSHERKKCILPKPALVLLGLKSFQDVTNLFLAQLGFERHKQIRLAEVAVVFRNFVLKYQMIPKRVPGQFRHQAMVLMRVVAVVSQNEVRRRGLQFLKSCLHVPADKRHEGVLKLLQQKALERGTFYKKRGRPP